MSTSVPVAQRPGTIRVRQRPRSEWVPPGEAPPGPAPIELPPVEPELPQGPSPEEPPLPAEVPPAPPQEQGRRAA